MLGLEGMVEEAVLVPGGVEEAVHHLGLLVVGSVCVVVSDEGLCVSAESHDLFTIH